MLIKQRLTASFLGLTIMANAESTLLDDFLPVDENFSLTYGPEMPAGSIVGVTAGDMVGGERDLEIVQTTSREPLVGASFYMRYEPHRFYSNQKFFYLGGDGPGENYPGEDAMIRIQYDGTGDEQGNTGLGKRLRNGGGGQALFNGADGGIRIWGSEPNGGENMQTTVTLRLAGSTLASFTRNVGRSDLFIAYEFPFAPEVFGEADSLTIEFRTFARGGSRSGFHISRIETIVPEGESGIALAAGVSALALAALRKRKVVNE